MVEMQHPELDHRDHVAHWRDFPFHLGICLGVRIELSPNCCTVNTSPAPTQCHIASPLVNTEANQ